MGKATNVVLVHRRLETDVEGMPFPFCLTALESEYRGKPQKRLKKREKKKKPHDKEWLLQHPHLRWLLPGQIQPVDLSHPSTGRGFRIFQDVQNGKEKIST